MIFFLMTKEQLPDSRMSSGKGSYQHLTAKAKKKKEIHRISIIRDEKIERESDMRGG